MKESKHGGARPNSGPYPKAEEERALNRTLRVTDKLWEAAYVAAKRAGKTRTRWIIDLMQREISRTDSQD